jgi:ribonuclease Z
MNMKIRNTVIASVFVLGIAVGVYFSTNGSSLISSSFAKASGRGEPMISPTEARERDFYAPNSETLDPDEISVISCGTGMPAPRPAQAAACFLMELGNGDKFIFDIGYGGAA